MRQLINIVFFILICFPVNAQVENDHYVAGLANLQRKEFKQAVSEFDKAIESESNKYKYYLKRGEAYFWLGEYLKAKDDFNKASLLERYSGSLGLAMTYAKMGDTDLAIKYLEDHLGSPFRVSEKSIKLNKAFESIENSRKWVELWKKRWYSSFEKLEQEIDYLTNAAQYPEALDLVEVYVSKYPDKAGAYALKGRINYARGKIREAEVNFSKAISLDSENPDFRKRRADVYFILGNFTMAVKDISNALRSDPSMFHLYIKRAGLYHRMDAGDKALDDLTSYLDYFPADEEALHLCGKIYIDQEKYYSALKCFSMNVENHPENPRSFIDRADAYILSGKYKYAIMDYGMALDLDPTNPATWLNRGKAYVRTGNNKQACYDFTWAVRLKSREGIKLYKEYCE
ncbi:MAG: tetratricopeptide repeat protein [Bacteroidetes bacterium]|nr:tetratricopeptide repeat protein [Bacteroidota bacterium]